MNSVSIRMVVPAALVGLPLSTSPSFAPNPRGVQERPVALANAARPCQQPLHTAGFQSYTVHSQGRMRSYLAFIPSGHGGRSALPVMLEFHGSGSDPRQQLAISGTARMAELHGLIVLLPVAATPYASGGHAWNIPPEPKWPDDVRFSLDVLEHAKTWACIDEERVYAIGFSGGARLVSQLACEAPKRLAAVAAVGGLRPPDRCSEGSVAVIAFHGTADPINPYTGGGPAYWGTSVESALRDWTRRNGCEPVAGQTRMSESVTKLAYTQCKSGDVVFYRIDGGGHTWPGSQFKFPSGRFGSTIRSLNATAAIIAFFMN